MLNDNYSMTITGLFVGFGISINYKILSEILKKVFPENITDDEDSNEYSDEDWNEKVRIMESRLMRYPIQMGMSVPLCIIMYPHTYESYKKEEVAVGFFEYLDGSSGNKETEFVLRNLLNQSNPPAFKKMLGENPKFMVIHDGCGCCS